jgi:sugar phosphate permease
MLSQNFRIATWRILGDGISGCPPRMPLFALCWMLNSFALGQEWDPQIASIGIHWTKEKRGRWPESGEQAKS